MLVLMRVMNSTYFFALRDCCWGATAAVGVVVVGVVMAGVGLVAALVWVWGVDVGSAAEAGGAGVACGEELFGRTVC